MSNILVIAPHADDEILGCGATMAKHIHNGDDVFVAIMTNANMGAPELFTKEHIEAIRDEANKAHEVIGVKRTFFFDLPAPRLETYPSYLIANLINQLIFEYDISTLYLPFRGDSHTDHRVVFNAALVAARPINLCPVMEIYAYETLSETEWGAPFGDDQFIPTFFVDVSNYMSIKLDSMNCFFSQLKNPPHPRSLEIISKLGSVRGSSIGVDFAESFVQIRRIDK